MTNFNIEEWLTSQKKGFGGKVSREAFIAKMKELGAEIEQLKKSQSDLTNQNKKLTGELKTAQGDLANKEKTIQEQSQTLQNQVGELKILQQRPDLTSEMYQELLNNQENHK